MSNFPNRTHGKNFMSWWKDCILPSDDENGCNGKGRVSWVVIER